VAAVLKGLNHRRGWMYVEVYIKKHGLPSRPVKKKAGTPCIKQNLPRGVKLLKILPESGSGGGSQLLGFGAGRIKVKGGYAV